MGFERKRGKLADLNAMLRGATDRFAEVVGDTAILQTPKGRKEVEVVDVKWLAVE